VKTLYGIPNCDTVKKARAALNAAGEAHAFHDFKKDGVTPALLRTFIRALGWEALLNRKGTTWRRLSEARRASITTEDAALALMLEQPSVIRRPVVVDGERITVGLD
jgi:arsenate reductase